MTRRHYEIAIAIVDRIFRSSVKQKRFNSVGGSKITAAVADDNSITIDVFIRVTTCGKTANLFLGAVIGVAAGENGA